MNKFSNLNSCIICLYIKIYIYSHVCANYSGKMSNLSPLASILKEIKLTGENYVDWKRNLDIVLASED